MSESVNLEEKGENLVEENGWAKLKERRFEWVRGTSCPGNKSTLRLMCHFVNRRRAGVGAST